MYYSACLARELAEQAMPGTPVLVVDSRAGAMAEGFVAMAAARAAEGAVALEEVASAVEIMKAKVHLIIMLDTLYYLAKGGRIPRAAAWAAALLSVKPILHFVDGEVSLLERSRTKTNAIERMLDLVQERLKPESRLHVALVHANVPEEALALQERVLSRFDLQKPTFPSSRR